MFYSRNARIAAEMRAARLIEMQARHAEAVNDLDHLTEVAYQAGCEFIAADEHIELCAEADLDYAIQVKLDAEDAYAWAVEQYRRAAERERRAAKRADTARRKLFEVINRDRLARFLAQSGDVDRDEVVVAEIPTHGPANGWRVERFEGGEAEDMGFADRSQYVSGWVVEGFNPSATWVIAEVGPTV